MAPFKVSEMEFARLQALQAMEATGQKKTGADVASDALLFGKRLVLAWLIGGTILFLIGGAFLLPWMLRGFSQLNTQNQSVRAQVQQSMQEQLHPNLGPPN